MLGVGLRPLAGSNPAGNMDVSLISSVVCCQVDISALGRSFVQRSVTVCDVSECDRRTSQRRPSSTKGCRAMCKRICLKMQFVPRSKHCMSVMTTNHLMLRGSEIDTVRNNTLCGQNVEFVNVIPGCI